jgi:lipid-A-disaccharide synthase
MKYYLIAGERSGDLHGSNLIKALKHEDPDAEFRFLGGEQMEEAGGTMYRSYHEISFMLIGDVIKNIFTIFKNFKLCAADVASYKPDVLILIDFSGFNMKVAKRIKPLGIPIHYYISPKIWAWNQSRAYNIKKLIDKMYVIMPFEKAFYKKYNYDVEYVGNPILDAIAAFNPNENFIVKHKLGQKPIIAILPGSRKQEVENMLSMMMQLSPLYTEYQFVIAAVNNLEESFYTPYIEKGFKVITNETYDLLSHAHAALVTSGTATLETALFNVPQVVCYRTGFFTYQIAKLLVKIKFISLVNLIADKGIVTELIQGDFNLNNLKVELDKVISGPTRQIVLNEYAELQKMMGPAGASDRVAKLIVKNSA